MNKRSNTRNWRLFLIRHVVLPQRSKRIYLNTIHSVFSGDFRSFCSSNLLNCIVTTIVVFLLVHVIWLILAVYMGLEATTPDQKMQHWRNFNILLFLITAMYPLTIALISILMLFQNLICTSEYDNMFVWHRNAVITYVQYLIGYTCMLASQSINIKLTKQ